MPKMSSAHKAALAEGREHGRAVRAYLEGLEASKPKRGRKRTPDTIRARLTAIEAKLSDASALERVQLIQERMDLEAELDKTRNGGVDMKALEKDFIASAPRYSESKGITYQAWREVGVEPRVLKAAGISRGR